MIHRLCFIIDLSLEGCLVSYLVIFQEIAKPLTRINLHLYFKGFPRDAGEQAAHHREQHRLPHDVFSRGSQALHRQHRGLGLPRPQTGRGRYLEPTYALIQAKKRPKCFLSCLTIILKKLVIQPGPKSFHEMSFPLGVYLQGFSRPDKYVVRFHLCI